MSTQGAQDKLPQLQPPGGQTEGGRVNALYNKTAECLLNLFWQNEATLTRIEWQGRPFPWDDFCTANPTALALMRQVNAELHYELSEHQCSWAVVAFCSGWSPIPKCQLVPTCHLPEGHLPPCHAEDYARLRHAFALSMESCYAYTPLARWHCAICRCPEHHPVHESPALQPGAKVTVARGGHGMRRNPAWRARKRWKREHRARRPQ